jgi:hypothetical protein
VKKTGACNPRLNYHHPPDGGIVKLNAPGFLERTDKVTRRGMKIQTSGKWFFGNHFKALA